MSNTNNNDSNIPAAIQPYLSNARRHHYIPEFLLRRFSTNPGGEHPPIYRLEIVTGAIAPISTRDCTVIRDYNLLSTASGIHTGYAEAMFAYTEGKASQLIKKLLKGGILSLEERVSFSNFLMAQEVRTPRGREWLRFGQNQAAKFWLLKQIYENRDITSERLRTELGREPTEDEINQAILQMAEPLENGELIASISSDQEILGMFIGAPEVVPLIGEMNWTLLEAPHGQNFILSDEPLVRIDPLNPDGPAGWRSSSTVEATMPLDPQYCLRLRQPPLTQNARVVTADEVLEVNLRTYAGAREAIFGPTEQLLESVNVAAKANAARVDFYRPKPPNMFVVERIEGEEKPSKVTRIPGPKDIKIRRKKK